MLSVVKITDGVYFLKQDRAIHPLSTSNGYLITPSQIHSETPTDFRDSLLLDVNLEENGWMALKKFCDDQGIPFPTRLIMTHCHLDHSSHIHQFVEIYDGHVYAPEPEVEVIVEHDGFFNVYQIQEMKETPRLMESYHHLKYEILKFGIIPKEKITTFKPGETFDFKTIKIGSIPLQAHSPGHVGVRITIPSKNLCLFHNSCLGLDQLKPNNEGVPKDGFGPWYGFKRSNISDYLKDIDKSGEIFQDCDILTSSHGIIFSKLSDVMEKFQGERLFIKKLTSEKEIAIPFEYMRRKIQEREDVIRDALTRLNVEEKDVNVVMESSELMGKLLDMDLIFSRSRIPSKQIAAYKFWERHLILNHLKRMIEN